MNIEDKFLLEMIEVKKKCFLEAIRGQVVNAFVSFAGEEYHFEAPLFSIDPNNEKWLYITNKTYMGVFTYGGIQKIECHSKLGISIVLKAFRVERIDIPFPVKISRN